MHKKEDIMKFGKINLIIGTVGILLVGSRKWSEKNG